LSTSTPKLYRPLSFLVAGWEHRALILQLSRRRVASRYRGSLLGGLWAVIHPLMMLCVYTFVFSFVLRARGTFASESEAHFALFVFSGMIVYAIFSESVNDAPSLVLNNRTYVKHLLFPVEVLPWVTVVSGLFGFLISFAILMIFSVAMNGQPPVTALLMPLLVLPVVFLALGFSWLLSSLGTFLQDLSQGTSVATTALFFLSPIFYPLSAIPEPIRRYSSLNPFAFTLESARGVLFEGVTPDWFVLGALTLISFVVAWLGYVWFMKTKGAFADVL
jgi:lipopolysaccharide transport system permease protein